MPINFKLYVKIDIAEQTYNFPYRSLHLLTTKNENTPKPKYAYHNNAVSFSFNSFWMVLFSFNVLISHSAVYLSLLCRNTHA